MTQKNKAKHKSDRKEYLQAAGRHEVLSAFYEPDKIIEIFVSGSMQPTALQKITQQAQRHNKKITILENREFIKRFTDSSQGAVAILKPFEYSTLDHIAQKALKNSQIIVALNGVEDPRNLGAITRTVEAAGADGLIITERRSAAMTDWAIRTAQGASSHLPVARVTNLADSLDNLKSKGFWITGLDARGADLYTEKLYGAPTVIVAGGESTGLKERVKSKCDHVVKIPLKGITTSLNVSVSVGIVLFEAFRQKDFL